MKKINITIVTLLSLSLIYSSCDLDRFPETKFSEVDFWNTESDLMNAANRLYVILGQMSPYSPDNRADDNTGQNVNGVSSGNRTIPNTSDDWSRPYDMIFTANNILEKGVKAQVSDAVKNRYFGEARFFRAYAYFSLLQKFGGVPLVLKVLSINSPDLKMPRSDRQTIVQTIYDDLDFAATWAPTRAALASTQYGRITRSAALAFKARVALYEGTRAKFHNDGEWQTHLNIAVQAASAVMGQGHTLFPSYSGLFIQAGEGPANTENILVKIYGVNNTNVILGHNYSRDLENGRAAATRNLLREYLYTDGLPAFNTDNAPSAKRSAFFVNERDEASYNTIFENRDPRMAATVFMNGETAYKGIWTPTTSLGSRTAYATKKGFNIPDWTTTNAGTVDRILIRYAEVLLIYAEAKYELDGAISDADLNLTINALRARAGFGARLTNTFVTGNNLSMREEIRRERTVELALEGFRYDDLIRWKTAERVLPQTLLGAKFNATDWVGTNPSSLNLNADGVLIVEDAGKRSFTENRDYLYPIPFNEITLSDGNVIQNPNWK
ncbi:RagB/SusD family nutrient uptake outer membrane protein [Pararcticibacter amylolyticus]|uniref:RagB/SusD family nutrient uptake outer membrane protein n=1 Tax=Pararcticibacter amylolyticus TaxID=2173175 RepID=A0A2U2PGP7_9SPHI|nr:RagB/SusD family nutrient uptake outer membrane protein [Pararcticibacter amylolyticus]PWG80504.1 RagB/SusD family nutrient uptake outer membrane protein [Pararcticibacter amylolyticus]